MRSRASRHALLQTRWLAVAEGHGANVFLHSVHRRRMPPNVRSPTIAVDHDPAARRMARGSRSRHQLDPNHAAAKEESDLLFPSVNGKFRAPTVLNKPFADVADMMASGRSSRSAAFAGRSKDLARAAQVEGIVTRSISGHATERMQEHYSTVHGSVTVRART